MSVHLILVAIFGSTPQEGTWYQPLQWSYDPESYSVGKSCDVGAVPSGLLQPVGGFGGVWCDYEFIRKAIGFATANEYEVRDANLLQEFEKGYILRDSRRDHYMLFLDQVSSDGPSGHYAVATVWAVR